MNLVKLDFTPKEAYEIYTGLKGIEELLHKHGGARDWLIDLVAYLSSELGEDTE